MKFNDYDEPKTGAGMFLKLSDGDEVLGVFRGNPYEYHIRWDDESKRSEEVSEDSEGAKFRFKINFVTKNSEGDYEAKIFENSLTVYNKLKEIHAEWDLENTVVKLSRKGEKLKTEYSIVPTKHKVPKEVLNVELRNLEPDTKPKAHAPNGTYDPEIDEIPF